MTPGEVLQAIRDSGARVDARDGELVIQGSREQLNGLHIEAQLMKGEILALLAAEDRPERERIPEWAPFPVDALPEPMRGFVLHAARVIGFDVAQLALPALAATAGAIGNTRALRLKRTWLEPSILWTGTVQRSGGGKSPPFQVTLRPVSRMQAEKMEEYHKARKEHKRKVETYTEAADAWKRGRGPKPQKPNDEEPRPVELLADDITTETLAGLLRDNPHGLTGAPEELSGFFGALDAYKKAKVDASRWLRMYDGGYLKVNRKTGENRDRLIFVRRAAVSLTGTIQFRTLCRYARPELFENGLLARFILAMPPVVRPPWTEEEIPPETENAMERLFRDLYALEGLPEEGEEGREEDDGPRSIRPVPVPLSPEARKAWVTFFNEFRLEEDPDDERQAALWAKTVGRAARFALVYHVVSEVHAGRDGTAALSIASMESGITLARWTLREGERVYTWLRGHVAGEAGVQGVDAPLVAWVESRGGETTARELYSKGPSRFRGRAEKAEAALQALVKAGAGAWEPSVPGPEGGRPSRVFRLIVRGSGSETQEVQRETRVPLPPQEAPARRSMHEPRPIPRQEEEEEPWAPV